MTLVNATDANRENMDEYLTELSSISDKQLDLLSTLQEVSHLGYSSLTKFLIAALLTIHRPLLFHTSHLWATIPPKAQTTGKITTYPLHTLMNPLTLEIEMLRISVSSFDELV